MRSAVLPTTVPHRRCAHGADQDESADCLAMSRMTQAAAHGMCMRSGATTQTRASSAGRAAFWSCIGGHEMRFETEVVRDSAAPRDDLVVQLDVREVVGPKFTAPSTRRPLQSRTVLDHQHRAGASRISSQSPESRASRVLVA